MPRWLRNLIVYGLLVAGAVIYFGDSSKSHINKGVDYFNQGNYREAEAEFQKAIKQDPDKPIGHYNLATIYCRQKQWQKAADELNITLDLDPDYPNAEDLLIDVEVQIDALPEPE